jgi:hypothetical protein
VVTAVNPDLMFSLWPLALTVGWILFVLSFLLPEPAAAMVLRVLALIALVIAAVFTIPGIA